MQRFDDSSQYIICHSKDREYIDNYTELKQAHDLDNIAIYSIPIGFDVNTLNLPSNLILNRYLDLFFILIQIDDNELSQEVVDSFFEYIANTYDDIVHVNQNIENISNLIEIIKQNNTISEDSILLDYGCGTGLVTKLKEYRSLMIYGYDNCPTMRSISERRGLTVLSEDELYGNKQLMFDSIYASYVFHLYFDEKGFELIWSRLKSNGMIVGNFHKGRGVDRISNFMRDLDPLHQIIQYGSSDKHGAYIGFLKK